MKHGRDLDEVMTQAIDDSVVAVDDLANRLVAKLRDDTSRSRMVLKPFNGCNDAFDNKVSVVCRVPGNIRADRLDVLDRLRCPEELGHRSRRRFASA